MSASKILVATDFSDRSMRAVEFASAHAKMTGATLLIAHVYSVPAGNEGEGMLHGGIEREDLQTIERRLESVRPAAHAVDFEHRLLKGNPAREILRLAHEENVALIVMGTHGRTGLMRLLMGSVAEEVVRHARCPVLTIKVPVEPK